MTRQRGPSAGDGIQTCGERLSEGRIQTCGERPAEGRVPICGERPSEGRIQACGQGTGAPGEDGPGEIRPGQDIVVSKWIGLEGTCLLARRRRGELLERYPERLLDEAARFDRYLSTDREAGIAREQGASAVRTVREGGIFRALWELGESCGAGFAADLRSFPLRQETVEICEYFRADPYRLLSGGCLLMTADRGDRLAAALKEAGIPAVCVGEIRPGPGRILLCQGRRRFLNRPGRDEIERLLEARQEERPEENS